jgi:predicted metal-dependent HD superfamily phosphohydrolase
MPKFFDIWTIKESEYHAVKDSFLADLGRTLSNMKVLPTQSVASALWERMLVPDIHYHTAAHIQFMLEWAKKVGIELEPWQKASIYFHDSVYEPSNKKNEECSKDFLFAMLGPYVDPYLLKKMGEAILETKASFHLMEDYHPIHPFICDLDLAGFADTESQLTINHCLRLEFNYLKEKDYNQGRREFLEKLSMRKQLYHTPQMKPFEETARTNILKGIEECNELLKK